MASSLDCGPARLSADKTVIEHADRLLPQVQALRDDARARVEIALEAVFADEALQKQFYGSRIRLITMCGNIAREILYTLGESPDQISIMAIGDVDLPQFAKEAMDTIDKRVAENRALLAKQYGRGYDYTVKGFYEVREALFEFFDPSYGFPEDLKRKFAKNSTFTTGGMNALDLFVTSRVRESEKAGKRNRFISPDNSYDTWFAVLEERTHGGKNADAHTIATHQRNLLHLSAQDIDEFYEKNPPAENTEDSWYITPVGNPSGTKMRPAQLIETCEAILKHSPAAVILLDCVYVRTLLAEQSRALMGAIWANPQVLDRIVFVESFSKTHGICGERVGMFFAANDEVFGSVQHKNMLLTAGQGNIKSAIALAIAQSSPEEKAIFEKLKMFWAAERKGLYNYLVKSGQFNDLFDEADQTHILPEDIDDPLGIYVFLKLKKGVTAQQVAMRTTCVGVDPEVFGGLYLRFAVGRITQPTYAKYA